MPAAASSGSSAARYVVYASSIRPMHSVRIASSCAPGGHPSMLKVSTPLSICCSSPATRTMKNSSRLELRIARNLTRSISGLRESHASSRTRRWNRRRLNSELR